jgi:hypothetical protein
MLKRMTIAAAIVALALATTAYAGNGGGSNRWSSSISLVWPSASALTSAATSEPHYGDSVTFDVSTNATDFPYVNLRCFQNGSLVGEGWAGFFDGALGTHTFTLWSPQWSGGAADCTASLDAYGGGGKWKELASTSFHVSA